MADRPPAYVRRIARDVLAVCVGFGLGIAYSSVVGTGVDDGRPQANGQRTERSSTVSDATWTDGRWPFTIESGELTCIGPADDPGVFIVADNGDTFALNPAAIRMADRVGAIADLDPIWRADADILGTRVNVSPMILYALRSVSGKPRRRTDPAVLRSIEALDGQHAAPRVLRVSTILVRQTGNTTLT